MYGSNVVLPNCRSISVSRMLLQVLLISFLYCSREIRRVFFRRSLLRLPSGLQCKAVLGMGAPWRVTCFIHLQRLLIRMVAMGSFPRHTNRSFQENDRSIKMTLVQKMSRIHQRLFVSNVDSIVKLLPIASISNRIAELLGHSCTRDPACYEYCRWSSAIPCLSCWESFWFCWDRSECSDLFLYLCRWCW